MTPPTSRPAGGCPGVVAAPGGVGELPDGNCRGVRSGEDARRRPPLLHGLDARPGGVRPGRPETSPVPAARAVAPAAPGGDIRDRGGVRPPRGRSFYRGWPPPPAAALADAPLCWGSRLPLERKRGPPPFAPP